VGLFSKRQAPQAAPPELAERIAHLEAEVLKVQSELRQLEGEQILLHDQCRKWMRRQVAEGRNQERAAGAVTDGVTPSPPMLNRVMTGARARILARRAAAARVSEPVTEAEE